MKLLIITQKVDREDDILGFFYHWIEKFAKKFIFLNIICLQLGNHSLPSNVKVWSLRKETGRSKIKYLFKFYRYIWKLRKDYNLVFIHMNPIYLILGGILWKIWRKKIFLWYNHQSGDSITRLAIKIANNVFYTSPFSFASQFKKSKIMPAGIDTDIFKRNEKIQRIENSILYLGRISPIKNVDILVKAAKLLDKKGVDFILNIVGEPGEKDEEYFKKIKSLSNDLEIKGKIKFWGKFPNYQTPEIYNQNKVFINLSPAGSLDKATLEAMACETLALVSNKSYYGILPDYLIFSEGNFEELAQKIQNLMKMSTEEREKIGENLRKIVIENHNLENLVEKIIKNF